MIRIAVVDDDREVRDVFTGYINRFMAESHVQIRISEFADVDEILQDYSAE